jgi:hypothetical protein
MQVGLIKTGFGKVSEYGDEDVGLTRYSRSFLATTFSCAG